VRERRRRSGARAWLGPHTAWCALRPAWPLPLTNQHLPGLDWRVARSRFFRACHASLAEPLLRSFFLGTLSGGDVLARPRRRGEHAAATRALAAQLRTGRLSRDRRDAQTRRQPVFGTLVHLAAALGSVGSARIWRLAALSALWRLSVRTWASSAESRRHGARAVCLLDHAAQG
jgi:hypothetical protein